MTANFELQAIHAKTGYILMDDEIHICHAGGDYTGSTTRSICDSAAAGRSGYPSPSG